MIMEKQILEMLNENARRTYSYNDNIIAKEIDILTKEHWHEHHMKFVEWLGIMSSEIWWNDFHKHWDWITINGIITENITQYTTNGLYNYWLTEILNKK
jgi:hypothetical protein